MGASVSRLFSYPNAPKVSSDSVPHQLGLLELGMAANGRAT